MPSSCTWQTLDWALLERLREQFLAGRPLTGSGSYWTSVADVAGYDFTYAQRIGWKWDAVLQELEGRGWTPPTGWVLDWGCGSGAAGRCVLRAFGTQTLTGLRLFDRSAFAMEYARDAAANAFADLAIETLSVTGVEALPSVGMLVLSHVLNELDDSARHSVRRAIDRADSVLWVEPGTWAESRGLIEWRESLREQFELVAPCPHQAACGLLAAGNEGHWCHHFAVPPPGIMADPNWVGFARRAGIDLRSLPYSFLVLERKGARPRPPGRLSPGCSRVIGRPRILKGSATLFGCDEEGVRELELPKRTDRAVFKAFKDHQAGPLWRWTRRDGRILDPKPVEKMVGTADITAADAVQPAVKGTPQA